MSTSIWTSENRHECKTLSSSSLCTPCKSLEVSTTQGATRRLHEKWRVFSSLCETSKHDGSAGSLPCHFHTTFCHCHYDKRRKLMAEQHQLMANNGAPRLAFCPTALWSVIRSSGLAHRLLEKCCKRLHPLQPSTCLRRSHYMTKCHMTR